MRVTENLYKSATTILIRRKNLVVYRLWTLWKVPLSLRTVSKKRPSLQSPHPLQVMFAEDPAPLQPLRRLFIHQNQEKDYKENALTVVNPSQAITLFRLT